MWRSGPVVGAGERRQLVRIQLLCMWSQDVCVHRGRIGVCHFISSVIAARRISAHLSGSSN